MPLFRVLPFFFKDIFHVDYYKSLYRTCYNIACVLCFGFYVLGVFGCKANKTFAPQPGIEPASPALEGIVLTTGQPGTSLCDLF